MPKLYDARLVIEMDDVETETVDVGEAITGTPDGRTEDHITGNWFRVSARRGDEEIWSARVLLSDEGNRVADKQVNSPTVRGTLLDDKQLIDLVGGCEQLIWSAVS